MISWGEASTSPNEDVERVKSQKERRKIIL
jgi:hypothetical protein